MKSVILTEETEHGVIFRCYDILFGIKIKMNKKDFDYIIEQIMCMAHE